MRLSLIAAALAIPTSVAHAEMLASPQVDLREGLQVCAQSLRTGENPPAVVGWRPSVHRSGTPYGVAALRARNIAAMMEAAVYSRESFVLNERHLTLTQYYHRGEYIACSISGDVAAEAQIELAQTLTVNLERRSNTGDRVAELRRQYLLANTNDAYRLGQFTLLVEPGIADNPDNISLIVVKD